MPRPPDDFAFVVDAAQSGQRLDRFLRDNLPQCSRSFLNRLVREGWVRVDDRARKPGHRLRQGERVRGTLPAPAPARFQAEAIALDILFEDDCLIAVNKPPGMVVHPAPGHAAGTLANALLHHCPDLAPIAGEMRPGIVHRLDKDTSGVLVAAKQPQVLAALAHQFKTRQVVKRYLALVLGVPGSASGCIDLPVGRHPVDRKRMSVRSRHPRAAQTEWRLAAAFGGCALLDVRILTGRTHQIRVHCAAMGHPVVGDPVYGGAVARRRQALAKPVRDLLAPLRRQMLHAASLGLAHPESGQPLHFEAPLPEDMRRVVDALESLSGSS